ncbi:Thiamine phosphate phosphatase-like protein [Dissostichus eleginoides]|uniref:Thiamine phosphate phosphatase-like protein n=1 Tax=Dissostichus eleginoides TaxID=100907 RepID=A0AAD9FBD2_DISEL|nr:Thiamine phosphate phosphatase-like protein [Dissostichus eleginoides]
MTPLSVVEISSIVLGKIFKSSILQIRECRKKYVIPPHTITALFPWHMKQFCLKLLDANHFVLEHVDILSSFSTDESHNPVK